MEVLFDADFIGGGDLHGRCQGRCGVMLPPADLLNLAKPHFSNVTGAHQSWCQKSPRSQQLLIDTVLVHHVTLLAVEQA